MRLVLLSFLLFFATVAGAQCPIGSAYLWSTVTPTTINVPILITGTWKQNIININVTAGRTYMVGNCAQIGGTNPSPAAGTSVTVRDASNAVITWASDPTGGVCAVFTATYTGVASAHLYNNSCGTETVGFTASVVWSGCSVPTALNATGITVSSANLSWAQGFNTPTGGYQYAVTATNTPPVSGTATTGTTYNATGLQPGTKYYLHVRQDCGGTLSWSEWVSKDFTTINCDKPNLAIKNITASSADISWNTSTGSADFDYTLGINRTTPGSGTSLSNTTGTSASFTQLAEGTKYYVWLRSNCSPTINSGWVLDSFTTRTVCRHPELKVDHIEANRAVVYWQHMPTAVAYDYEISESPTPIGSGTRIKGNSFYAFPLKDGAVYYYHVRSSCADQGFESMSDWTTTAFQTFPTSVGNMDNDAVSLAVYPNPATNYVTVGLGGMGTIDGTITISNLNGSVLQSQKVSAKTTNVDISNLPAGIYMLKYTDGTFSQTVKIHKQ